MTENCVMFRLRFFFRPFFFSSASSSSLSWWRDSAHRNKQTILLIHLRLLLPSSHQFFSPCFIILSSFLLFIIIIFFILIFPYAADYYGGRFEGALTNGWSCLFLSAVFSLGAATWPVISGREGEREGREHDDRTSCARNRDLLRK